MKRARITRSMPSTLSCVTRVRRRVMLRNFLALGLTACLRGLDVGDEAVDFAGEVLGLFREIAGGG